MRKHLGVIVGALVVAGLIGGAIFYYLYQKDPRRAVEDFVYGVRDDPPERAYNALAHDTLILMGYNYGEEYQAKKITNLFSYHQSLLRDLKGIAGATWVPASDAAGTRLDGMIRRDLPDGTVEFVDRAAEPDVVYTLRQVDGTWKISEIHTE
jgi:hypothetical protein